MMVGSRWLHFVAIMLLMIVSSAKAQLPGENFTPKRMVNANTTSGRLRHPFAMVMGPNDSLWITEKRGYLIRMHRINGSKQVLLDIHHKVKFTSTVNGSGTVTSIAQDGVLGLALHPELNKGTGHDFIYLAYCYDSVGIRRTRLVQYHYSRSLFSGNDTLDQETILITGIWGSNDHNGGRICIGNFGTVTTPDYKIMYSVGDRGANQFSNACDSIESQYLPTASQLTAHDLHRYNGKILRMNMDGTIPADNPFFNGVQSHIWSYGHRNPQGLSFEKDDNNVLVPKGKLFESEQGPATSDEVNLIDSGYNYGWPRVAGKRDDVWYKYYQWSNSVSPACSAYTTECSATQTNSGLTESSFIDSRYKDPMFDLFPGAPPLVGGVANTCNWLTYPTIAPSSVLYYPYQTRIPGWGNSLLLTTLKNSSLYRLQLNATGTAPLASNDSVVRYFHDNTALNRFRDIAVASDGISIYILTDSIGATSGPSAGSDGGLTNRGAVLEYKYVGAVLAIPNSTNTSTGTAGFSVYPNPSNGSFNIRVPAGVSRPLIYVIADLSGRVIEKGMGFRANINVQMPHHPAGMYLLTVQSITGTLLLNAKLIIQ